MVMRQLTLPVSLRDDATFENFYVRTADREAVHAVRVLAGEGGFRCICLSGGAGSGRSHLLQAACHEAFDAGREALYLPLGEVVDCDPRGLLEASGMPGLVCVDDLDRAAGDRAWEESLFHLYNRLHADGGALLVAASAPPAALGLALADLASRLGAGQVYRLAGLDDAGKEAALQLRAARRGLVLESAVARYLLERLPREWTELLAVLDRLDEASLAHQRRLTIPFVREVLGVR